MGDQDACRPVEAFGSDRGKGLDGAEHEAHRTGETGGIDATLGQVEHDRRRVDARDLPVRTGGSERDHLFAAAGADNQNPPRGSHPALEDGEHHGEDRIAARYRLAGPRDILLHSLEPVRPRIADAHQAISSRVPSRAAPPCEAGPVPPDPPTTGEAPPISVLWLAKGLGPGGMEQLLLAHARTGDHSRFAYRVAYLHPDKNHLVAALGAAGVEARCLNARRSWDLRWVLRLRKMQRASPAVVVHAHSPLVAALARVALRTLPWRHRPELMATEHNTWDSFGTLTHWANRLTFGLDRDHIAVSESVRSSIPARLQPSVTTVVHGIDRREVTKQRQYRDAVRAELGIADDEVVIGIVANYRPQKDYPNVLRAARTVVDAQPSVRFVAVGQGPLEADVKRLHGELGLGDRFLLLGYRPDATRVMSGFDVFTLGSIHEGLPVALMEARAMGLAVVVTRVGGLPQHVADGIDGRLVPARDNGALADALLDVAADPVARARLGAASLARSADYDAAGATAEIESRYRIVAGRRSKP